MKIDKQILKQLVIIIVVFAIMILIIYLIFTGQLLTQDEAEDELIKIIIK